MYRFLRSHLPPLAADLVMASWLFLLILAVVYCSLEPQAEFKYQFM